MELYNLKHPDERVNFSRAVRQGLGSDQGLFFPTELPQLDWAELKGLDFASRSARLLSALIGDEVPADTIQSLVSDAFSFPVPVVPVAGDISALELFHGPTLAFKDFGGRFMARVLRLLASAAASAETGEGKAETITILTATSGDTGAAVAHAFHGIENIEVVILYPEGKISPLQEKLFCTLGGNIRTYAVDADFDACQALVKQAFDDQELKQAIGLNSANSINISRLLAQICYYAEAVAQYPDGVEPVISVPSGNFGNLTAGLLARSLGVPIKRFVATTNSNDTVPRYLQSGQWQPKATIATLSNAMDVSQPNNWPRVEELRAKYPQRAGELAGEVVGEAETAEALRELHRLGYLCEPHGAVAYRGLSRQLQPGEQGLFLCTAHPAKFLESVEQLLDIQVELPQALAEVADKPLLSGKIPADYAALRAELL